MVKLISLAILTTVEFGHAAPVSMADPIFAGIAKRVAPKMGATLKSNTLQLFRGLTLGGDDCHQFWLTAHW